ncbi:APC family permease [Glutamicibacter protophormiae]|uniref:Amino acid transporter n=1 Tax=Glutamicibacter protophormiae TaxID=37930 RepID=A0ABS4XM42_GLUPR|nr:APC family permease [Glutamicibacter protophormiae]MBP2397571.1 amino acid transporter [Glutamicibacter protophormiae]GGL78100.1 amino acid permease [Glutamicibacter protophormiae]
MSVNTESKLKKGITGPLLYLFILGDILGAGVYALVGEVASEAGGAIWAPLFVALILALLTATSYAELVTKYPKAGGAAIFAERAFKKPVVSFLVGFSMLAAGVTSAAGLSIAFAGDYLSVFFEAPTIPVAIAFLGLVALLNARGIKESVRANVGMTAIELSGLLLVIVVAALFLGGGNGDASRLTQFPDDTTPVAAIFAGSLLAYYSFVGFEVSANVAEEVIDVPRVYPRALFAALLTAGVVYLALGVLTSIAMDPKDLAGSSSPLLDVVQATGAGIPSWLFSLVALVAVANGALLTMIMSSRLAFGMAEQGLLPPVLGRVLPHRRTPWVAIIGTTLIAMLLTLTGDLATLAKTVVLLLLFVFTSTNLAVIVLRRDRVEHRHFRAPIIIPYLALASCAVLLVQQDGGIWLRGLALLALGAVLYFVTRWITSRSGKRPS